MYPWPRKKRKALAYLGMQVARELVGDDADANELVEIAKKVLFGFCSLICMIVSVK
jgi:hypothetical protein